MTFISRQPKRRQRTEVPDPGHDLLPRALLARPLLGLRRLVEAAVNPDGAAIVHVAGNLHSRRQQHQAEAVLRSTATALTQLFDVTATKDWANCEARADITVDGRALLRDVPVSYLLFLEKQLTEKLKQKLKKKAHVAGI